MEGSPEQIPVYKVHDLGVEHGLSVLLTPLLDDYLYPILPISGWKASRTYASRASFKMSDRWEI